MLVASSNALSNDKGKELHKESCITCHIVEHNNTFYTRNNSRLHNHFDLRKQVSNCVNAFNINWLPDEEKSVVNHLNNEYYDFRK
ncbi:hypothetical protein [Candidatus Vesicomyidisocius calyptogenae]|uniref:Cytochrome c domain-containing protein n=1 Tax=Vesicomyosocius okutanii subsp. Calyptogena okutanii (strain HA) TaxID=412965 RepID=A5CWK8_VESOH|nr:hypothetical protein [Candidatus Vesicomyosocius okutanii]BAF61660.1 conserved hypothetical protein [Candidatus Vesicomyosocius okutanii]